MYERRNITLLVFLRCSYKQKTEYKETIAFYVLANERSTRYI